MRFAPEILDEIRNRLPVSQVVSRKVAIKKAGREYRGLSPFKSEKSPSFFVNDQKGFYHCFASGEHGDIFTFLMKTEGLSFPEAVERLAEEAGVHLPKPTAQDTNHEDARQRLYRLMEETQAFFVRSLFETSGQVARDYLERRGLRRQTIDTFGIGFAPGGRSDLKAHLTKLGYSLDEMITAGVLIGGEDIAVPYDRFRNRVMFPIGDLKGRVIAFGGRALDPNQPAKYHNSPETPLFHKGHTLYNAHRARPLAYDRGQIVIVEGYMDVVALSQAGIGHAVAPLGTALTEDQIQLVWRMVPEPVLCFDGDSAGRKAAFRAIDTLIPHLKPGVSASFAFLPEGLDPDDLVRQQGAAAMEAVLARARPLDDVLFEREWESGTWSTPERRAQLEKRLREIIQRIGDSSVRGHYERAIRERLFKEWGASRSVRAAGAVAGGSRAGGFGWRKGSAGGGTAGQARNSGFSSGVSNGSQPPGAAAFGPISDSLKRSGLVAGEALKPPYREALLVGTLLNHPWLLAENLEEVADLHLTSPALSSLRNALLGLIADDNSLDSVEIRSQLRSAGLHGALDLLERALTHRSDKFVDPDAGPAEVDMGWRHTLAVHQRQFGLQKELEAAERAFFDEGTDEAWARICEVKALLAQPDVLEFPPDS